MDIRRLGLLFHTVKYLRFRQIYYRAYYFLRTRFFKKGYQRPLTGQVQPLSWQDLFEYTDSYKKNKEFEFLNLGHAFNSGIDWNYNTYGKLWTYNLNYFDFLNQELITLEEGLQLIKDYINTDEGLRDGKEPYPISLRGINWIKFLSKHSISDMEINQTLYSHYQILLHNLEYHLLGNHLLENGFSLFFGAYYFRDEVLYKKAIQILIKELDEQVLSDGAHFELSPMYHQILLHRLLDCIRLSQLNPWKEDTSFLKEKAVKMLSWLEAVTFSNGNIPMVNDSAYGIAPTSKQLFNYGKELGLDWAKGKLGDSGYRKFNQSNYELFVDVGNIGPTYQPGHAHSDTFSFELYVDKNPIIVDTGTSTYEKNALRQQERETESHNTVKVGNQEQTEVWGGFRVAKRAKIVKLEESPNHVQASHDGYSNLGIEHTRKVISEPSRIIIQDFLNKEVEENQTAYFHFHPSVKQIEIYENTVRLTKEDIRLTFKNSLELKQLSYQYAIGFNKREEAKKIAVSFRKTLNTQIDL
ncbi:heparinase II/III family protein [Flagellimonas sp. HMM57]|uniref:alginate lyase family protein n=1 Tax=unclassified Flagellimonas TaxID=2644544 RepID=UPI0013D53C70|nr:MULTISPECIES: alginate lyase family protein [unclassified Flagellimonas]UII77596.1 heparinase II/III family protein [Flagellimonas sp. HMM57]